LPLFLALWINDEVALQTQNPHPQGLIMSGKNRIREVIEVSTAVLTLIALTMQLSFILAPLDDPWAVALGATNT
jgi:hypothetical protein